MQALRHALRSSTSVGGTSADTSRSVGATSIEDSERQGQAVSPVGDFSPAGLLLKPTPRHSYCWPPAPPTSHRAWQRRSRGAPQQIRGRATSLRRTLSAPRVAQYPRAPTRTSSLTLKVEETLTIHQGVMHALPSHTGPIHWLLEGNSAQSATPSRSTSPTLRRSASLPGPVVLAASPSVPALEQPRGHAMRPRSSGRARSTSPLCSPLGSCVPPVVPPPETSAPTPAPPANYLWSARSSWKTGSAAGSMPCSRSPSPVASLAAPPGPAAPGPSRSPSPPDGGTPVVERRYIEPHLLVKIRDSPPRLASRRGSLVHRSHWRLVKTRQSLRCRAGGETPQT